MNVKQFESSIGIDQYFPDHLLDKKGYAIHAPQVEHKLDQNECYFDWSDTLKNKVTDRLIAMNWNRYPQAFSGELEKKLADDIGVPAECILSGPGSDYLGVLILKAFSFGKPTIHIASPTFPVYVIQAGLHGFEYKLWPLSNDLEYDFSTLELDDSKSNVVFFASPNNPTGGVVSNETLEKALKNHPNTIFIADEAYFEFADSSFLPLLETYSNLIVMRTASKTLASAGVRFGYICGPSNLINQIRKFRLPYSLNHFTTAAIEVFIESKEAKDQADLYCNQIKSERKLIFDHLSKLNSKLVDVVYPSWANFLLIRFKSDEIKNKVYQSLIKDYSILVRDVSAAHMLERCLRYTIGMPDQNKLFLKAIEEISS